MPLHAVAFVLAVLLGWAVARAESKFTAPGWGLSAVFPKTPTVDDQRIPTDRGDEIAERRYVEHNGERFMLTRITYPVVPLSSMRRALYVHAIEAFMNSRRGEIREDALHQFGDHVGQRLLIEHRRDKSHREVRLVLIGGSLYFVSAEWVGGRTPTASAARFLQSLSVPPEFANPALVEDRERWRELSSGNFTLRYDASRWYRDPAGGSEGTVLLHVDQLAEAEFVTGPRHEAKSMEEVVIAAARETAERVTVRKRGRRLQGSTTVEQLRFTVRAEGVTYENSGSFYNGPEGSVQVRAWSPEKTFSQVDGDIDELLEGLVIRPAARVAGN